MRHQHRGPWPLTHTHTQGPEPKENLSRVALGTGAPLRWPAVPGHAGNIHTRCSYGHEHISPRNKYFHGEGRREGGGHWYTYAFCSPLGFGRLEFVLSESEHAKGKWFLILIRCGVPRLLKLRPALTPGMKKRKARGDDCTFSSQIPS